MVLIIILAGIIILAVFYGSSPRYGDDTEENLKRTPYQPSRKKNQSTINDEKSKNNKKKYLNPPIDIRSQTNNQTPKHKIELFDANEDYASSQKIIGEGDTNKEALSNLRKQKGEDRKNEAKHKATKGPFLCTANPGIHLLVAEMKPKA